MLIHLLCGPSMMESIDIRHLPETSSEPVVAKKFKSVVFPALDCPYVELEILLTSDWDNPQ